MIITILDVMIGLFSHVQKMSSLPARIKEPTQEMKPERKELNGKVPTNRQ